MDSLYSLATEHFILSLQPLNRALRAAVENQRVLAARLASPQLAPLCLTDEHVNILLEQIDITQSGNALPGIPAALNDEEQSVEEELRARCAALGAHLPLDQLARAFALSPFEQEVLLICAAPELDRTYERIYGFILDDLNRRYPSIDLLISLTSSSVEQRIARRHSLAGAAKLRRLNILQAIGDPPVELRQELRLASGIFEFLTGVPMDISSLCRDRDAVAIPEEIAAPAGVSREEFEHLCDAFAGGSISVLGIWGARQNGPAELALALANALNIPLRLLRPLDPEQSSHEHAHSLERQLRVAASLDAAVWFDANVLNDANRSRLEALLAEYLANAPVPVFLTGEHPWRPAAILRGGAYAECELATPPHEDCARLWSESLPELAPIELDHLASRYTLSGTDIRAASELTRLRARLAGNGHPERVQDHIAAACSLITRPGSSHFGVHIQPKRGPDDLILPPNLHRQVLEVAKFHDLSAQVDHAWGFGRLAGSTGLKALFTGDPGTGKTLSAEVIAGLLGLPLLKVDLARVVSKWVGETEKNLESAFREAEESHSILFFDEAEALFGKRGEVDHGTDRYANLEVSYLLQRLEMSRGLIILASNVKDQIDNAFVRRFQIVIHFPKPGIAERLRIWQRALPETAPLAKDIDYNALAKLDMTGAAIVSSARTAAFLAADASDPEITMAHLIRATARQFRREARVLMPTDLGSYGVLLQGAP
jgi:ATPase family associated with various cellular activities (AAA)